MVAQFFRKADLGVVVFAADSVESFKGASEWL
jgi:hypothetical protein